MSSINAVYLDDFDKDGSKDILLAGNLYQSEVETPRNDASYGLFLKNEGATNFNAVPGGKSGIVVRGSVRSITPIKIKGKKCVLFAINNEELIVMSIEN